MPKAPHKRKNRFYNHDQEKARHRVYNVMQVAWHVFARQFQVNRPSFLGANFDITPWVEPFDSKNILTPGSFVWLGHATCLFNIAGLVVMTDPVVGDLGRMFKRALPSPLNIEELVRIDVILISHNHRDHLDIPTLARLVRFNPLVLVPAGDAALMREIGFHRVLESSWHDSINIELNVPKALPAENIEIIFLPAIHWSGRGPLDVNRSLWGSWLVRTPNLSVYFAGDSAYSKHFSNISHRYGPPDIVFMPIAPENPRHLMASSHVGVEEAIQGFIDLAGTHFFPIHWGTFSFGVDRFLDPIDLLKNLWGKKSELGPKKLHIIPAGRLINIGAQ